MKKSILLAAAALTLAPSTLMAETVTLGGKQYTLERVIERQIGPGTTHLRLRLPQYPLNVNVLRVDLNSPYNRIETTVAKESARGTEALATAAARQSREGHRVLGGANANFWIVASQPEDQVWAGITRNASVRNGKMITESNQHRDQWDGGTMRTGVTTVSYDKTLHIDYCTSDISIWGDKIGLSPVHQCNKGYWADEIGMYNSHFGASNKFMPIDASGGKYFIVNGLTDVTEVILDFDEGGQWLSGQDMTFVVKEVRTATNGQGTLGNHDLALVGRSGYAPGLATLAPGDKVNLKYTWTFNPGTPEEVTPLVEQAVGGNALVMRGGELTAHNTNENYNSQVYSRTGYGCSADGKTLYIVVIDKSTDPVYGSSAGCPTSVMCELARYLGCSNMANFDAGGSAEMLIGDRVINTTTEGTPRAVANGWLVYSIAPEDDSTVASLAFYDNNLRQPVYATGSPQVIAYNKYGAVISYDYKDVTFTCDEAIGTCEGSLYSAAGSAATGTITAHCGDVSVSATMEVVNADVAMRCPVIILDSFRKYPLEVEAIVDGKSFIYNPAYLDWAVEDPTVASVDSEGVISGIATGTTTVTGTIGPRSVSATVRVEVPTETFSPCYPHSTWTIKVGTGMTKGDIDAAGNVPFEFTTRTAGYIEFTQKDNKVFSLPDEIWVDYSCDVPVAKISLDLLPANAARPVTITLEPAAPYAANTPQHLSADMAAAGIDPADMAIYPLEVRRARFTFETRNDNKGAHTFGLGGIMAEYSNYQSIESAVAAPADTRLWLSANPATPGAAVAVKAAGLTSATVYTIAGTPLSTTQVPEGDAATVTAPGAPGTYVVVAATAAGPRSSVLIVR